MGDRSLRGADRGQAVVVVEVAAGAGLTLATESRGTSAVPTLRTGTDFA
jgi:hypothetical protein